VIYLVITTTASASAVLFACYLLASEFITTATAALLPLLLFDRLVAKLPVGPSSVCLNTAVLPFCAPFLQAISFINSSMHIDTGCSKSVTYSPVDYKLPGPSQFALWRACFVESLTLIVESVTLIVETVTLIVPL